MGGQTFSTLCSTRILYLDLKCGHNLSLPINKLLPVTIWAANKLIYIRFVNFFNTKFVNTIFFECCFLALCFCNFFGLFFVLEMCDITLFGYV